ncbi:MAG: methionine ABC transporter ATP-binding protein [Negativicutes bacterium]|nr:methionine ABC transporter ATP-binding protein [Negativicutes bacterium]
MNRDEKKNILIHIKDVTKTYKGASGPIEALKGVSLDIEEGTVFGIIGLSGAGKSSLIRCINMLEEPTSGTVEIAGEEMTTLSKSELREARKGIGMIFQHFNLLSSRTVADNIAFPLELSGWSKEEIKNRVIELLELVGLSDKAQQYPAQLSGGQKQRVGIARALASKPRVLLCDEATSALDPQTTKSILTLLQDINRKLNLTIVLITHEMQVVKEICKEVAVIEDGLIIEQGTAYEVFTRPQHSTTKEFVGTIMNLELPESLAGQTWLPAFEPGCSMLLRVRFLGEATNEPVLAMLIRQFNWDVSILYGNIDHIQGQPQGTLVVSVDAEEGRIQEGLDALKAKNLDVEVIGYVAGND